MKLKMTALVSVLALGGCTVDTESWNAAGQAAAAQAAVQSQQTFNMAMGQVNQTQIGNLNTTTYSPIQKWDGTWIYCRRVTDQMVSCREN